MKKLHTIENTFPQAFLTPTHLGISMEFADDGNLLDYVNSKGAISEDESRWLFQQVQTP